MGDTVDREVIKRCLEEANIFEENMSDDLMASFYKAIKNSESSLKEEVSKNKDVVDLDKSLNESANELLEAINNSKVIAPLNETELKQNNDKELMNSETNDILEEVEEKCPNEKQEEEEENNNSIENEVNEKPVYKEAMVDIKKIHISFNDMPKSVHKDEYSLKLVDQELKYVNILNSKHFITSSKESRVKMLYNYHISASKLRSHYSSLSPNMAPFKSPVNLVELDQYENPAITSLKVQDLEFQETYISRSGRMTKRKIYIENEDSISDSISTPSTKKTKTDSEWLTKTTSKDKTPKNVVRKLDYENKANTIEKKDKFDELKEKTGTPLTPKPRSYQRKPTNQEIIERCSLFRDSPGSKKGRTESLVLAGKAEAEKLKEREEAMEKFTNSLEIDSDEDSQKIIAEENEEPFERRLVAPVARKPINGRKRTTMASDVSPLNITTKKINVNNNEVTNGVTKKEPQSQGKTAETKAGPSNVRGNKQANMTPCPLCLVPFPQKKIEEHAATCGEDLFAQPSQAKLSRISCEVCDQVIPLTTDYEVHVKQCIAKQNGL